MTACRSCGATHSDDTRLCPRTREPIDLGPCGTRVDRYQVETLLGMGGFGGVYTATHVNLAQRVAIKLLRARGDTDPLVAERFLREARAAAAIQSPHVVRVSDFGETEGGEAFLVMELLAGRDLDAMMRATPRVIEERCVGILLEVLAGLSAAHRAGVVHRDLKPANIFLAQEGGRELAKIVDFGISHARLRPEDRTLTAAGMILGTPAYMAPEQIQGRPVDARVDVYAAGVVLYQMLSGALPHEADTFERLVVLVCTEEPRPVRSVAPQLTYALAQVVDRAIARDPGARYQRADAFADALRAATGLPGGTITSPLGSATSPDVFAPTEAHLTPASLRPAMLQASAQAGSRTPIPPTSAPTPITIAPLYAPPSAAPRYALTSVPALHAPTSVDARTPIFQREYAPPAGLAPAHPRASIALPLLIIGAVLALALAAVAVAGVSLMLLQPTQTPRADTTLGPFATPPGATLPASTPVVPELAPAPTIVGPPGIPGAGVHWMEPRTVGDEIDTAAVRAILGSIAPACEECRLPGRVAHVNVQVMFSQTGGVGMIQANPNEPNDIEASRCVANRFRESAQGVRIATSGILILVAELDAR